MQKIYNYFKLGKGNGLRFSKIHLFYHKDEDKQYLTFEKVIVDRKGKSKNIILINNFTIDKKTADSILEIYESNRERTDVI